MLSLTNQRHLECDQSHTAHMHDPLYVCVYVCVHVCVYVCTYVCMYVWPSAQYMYITTYTTLKCTYIRNALCTYLRYSLGHWPKEASLVYMNTYVHHTWEWSTNIQMHTCMHTCSEYWRENWITALATFSHVPWVSAGGHQWKLSRVQPLPCRFPLQERLPAMKDKDGHHINQGMRPLYTFV